MNKKRHMVSLMDGLMFPPNTLHVKTNRKSHLILKNKRCVLFSDATQQNHFWFATEILSQTFLNNFLTFTFFH